jgi:serine/threonine protein kinase
MGQSHSNQAQTAAKIDFNPTVEVVQKVYEPHYGEIKIVKETTTQEQMILKDIVVNTKEAFEKEIDYLTKRVDVKHPNVVNILGYNTQDKKNFCSTYFKIALFIEYLEQDLQKEQDSRKAVGTTFSESEVLYIADNLIQGLSSFQSHGISHGDIRPFNIFIKDNNYKLSDPTLNAQKGSNGLTAAIVQGSKTLLSPQLLEQVPKGNFEIKADRYKADVFSLGATLLGLATLTNSEDFYDYQAGTINAALLEERLETLRNTHSEFTYELIKSMLIIEEEARPDFVLLSNRLLPFQDQIRSGYVNFSRGNFSFGETVKRSALPGQGEWDTDDLEARIKAALERTAATFRAVEARDKLVYESTTTHTTTAQYTTPQHTTTQYTTPQHTTYTPVEGEHAKRSAAVPTTPKEATPKSTTAPVDAGYTSTYTASYTPVVVEATYTTTTTNQGTGVPDVMKTSYTQPATYTYTSGNVPANSYTSPSYAAYGTTTPTAEATKYEVAATGDNATADNTKAYASGDYNYTSAYNQPYTSTYTTTTYNYSYSTSAQPEGTPAQPAVEGDVKVSQAVSQTAL